MTWKCRYISRKIVCRLDLLSPVDKAWKNKLIFKKSKSLAVFLKEVIGILSLTFLAFLYRFPAKQGPVVARLAAVPYNSRQQSRYSAVDVYGLLLVGSQSFSLQFVSIFVLILDYYVNTYEMKFHHLSSLCATISKIGIHHFAFILRVKVILFPF